VALTRKSKVLPAWVDVYSDMLANIISGKMTLKEASLDAGKKIGFNVK